MKDHLKKYAAFFRTVAIEDSTQNWIRVGISGPKAADIVTSLTGQPAPVGETLTQWDAGHALAVSDDSRFELWITPQKAQEAWQALAEKAHISATSSWQLADIQQGIAWVTAASRESWIPQHLNWQALNGVSFTKGCYTGQEIVARMKYLGKLKSHFVSLQCRMRTSSSCRRRDR